jgi:hypothetical protein
MDEELANNGNIRPLVTALREIDCSKRRVRDLSIIKPVGWADSFFRYSARLASRTQYRRIGISFETSMRTAGPSPPLPAIDLTREVCRKIQRTSVVMYLKTLTAIAIFSITTVATFAQDGPGNQASKPTLAGVQHLAEVITGDKSKIRAYCELGGIHDQMEQALDSTQPSPLLALCAAN